MKTYTAIIERCPDTGFYVGYVPGFPGAHSQGRTLDELSRNLKDAIEMVLEDGEPKFESEFVGTQKLEIEVKDKREKATLAINERIKVFAELIKKIGDISPGGDSVDDIRRERQ